MPRIACLHFPLWPLQQRMVAQPELRGRAIALFARDTSRGQRLTLCSPTAHVRGLRVGMPVAEAKAIDRRPTAPRRPARKNANDSRMRLSRSDRPTLLLAHDAAADRAALEQLAAWCERYSPLVGLEDTAEPTCLLLDVAGVAQLFGGEEKWCEKIVREMRQRGYEVQLGLADTIGAAWAAAQCGVQSAECEVKENEAICILPHSALRTSHSALASLPPAALRLPDDTLQLLDELGIVQIGQLLALPRDALAARLGELVVLRLQQAEGTAREVIVGHRPTEDFAASWSLEHPSDRQEVVAAVLAFVLDRLSHRLDEQDLGAMQLVCRFTVVDRPAMELTLGLFRPTAYAQHWQELLELQLDRRGQLGLVSGVRVEATATAALEVQQGELFANGQRDAPRELGLLIERLASRLGREAVVCAAAQTDALPELAVRYVPLTERKHESFSAASRKRRRSSRKAKQPPDAVIVSPRPLVVCTPPVALGSVIAVADGPPQRFDFHRQRHTIAATWGPERIETSWWRGRTQRRDYWRVETNTGQRFWLFCDLQDGKWFLHGQFA